ncbi:hypothetical protein OC00_16965 [Xanthomonas vasicola]|nr:hypothetical protein OC00_16965 [Xanthomonas vasicola]
MTCQALRGSSLPRFHPWPIAITQATVEVAGEGIVLGAYAGHVVAADIFSTVTYCRLHLIIQSADIGNVLRSLYLSLPVPSKQATNKRVCGFFWLTSKGAWN